MTQANRRVSDHYSHGDLLQRIDEALTATGKDAGDITFRDLGPVDEFHTGGRQATEHLFSGTQLQPSDHVLDIGCGLGGTARLLAGTHGCRVSGVDLTAEFVDVGNALAERVGLDSQIRLHQGDGRELPFPEAHFSAACMLHVGMNVPDKEQLFTEVRRVLRPDARFLVYDIVSLSGEDLVYPVPWASDPDHSHLATADDYQAALEAAGFRDVVSQSRQQYAIDFLDEVARRQASGAPSPLGLHLVMGPEAATKIGNMRRCMVDGRVAPFEFFATK